MTLSRIIFSIFVFNTICWENLSEQKTASTRHKIDSPIHRLCLLSVQFSRSVMSNSLQPHEPQHTRPPFLSLTPRVYPNSCPLSQWCHLTISSSVIPFSSCLQSFPTSRSFQMSQLFASGGQNIGISASTSVPPVNTQDWFPLGWTGWISLQTVVTVILTLINIHMLTFTKISISS